ncbi:hypothetical protein I4U23_017500 [Adineta vaga]|nr:hypothetical protein I4U23_017500 [Adineta vaga]
MSIPSQSQSSPIIHFTNTVRHGSSPLNPIVASPSISIDYDSQQEYAAFITRPQSTPISSPVLLSRTSINPFQTNENFITILRNTKKQRLTTFDNSSFTNVTPLQEINNQIQSPVLLDISDNDEQDRYFLRPPPLMVLSQTIQAKYPEKLTDSKLNNRFSSIKDLPHSPANYSFVFYGFTSFQIEEAKRLTRRMGDCFTSEIIDITTTHIILPNDNSQMMVTLDLILALIYGCRLVSFEWLKSSSRIGEWLRVNKFEPKNFFNSNPSLNIYRKFRQQRTSIQLFNQCGLIYLTSLVQQRELLVKLITLLGGNITVNRERAKIIVGRSSKILQVIVHPQVQEQWVIDSIKVGKSLSTDDYLIQNSLQITLTATETCAYHIGVGFWSLPSLIAAPISIWILLWKQNLISCCLTFVIHVCSTLFATTIIIISFLVLIGLISSPCSSTTNYFLPINICLIIVSVILKLFIYGEILLLYFLQHHVNKPIILSEKQFQEKNYEIITNDSNVQPWKVFRSILKKTQNNITDIDA